MVASPAGGREERRRGRDRAIEGERCAMSFRGKAQLSLVTAAVLAVLAGCGSSDDSSSTGASTAATDGSATAAAPGNAPKGDPIKLGAISSCGGALSSGLGGACPTIKAWESWVNEHGGVNGHPVSVTVIDDQGVPEKGLAAAKKLIEQEGVVAIVGMYSVTNPAWAAYVEQKGVPVVGGGSTEPSFTNNPVFFPSGSQVPAYQYAQATVAKKLGKTKLGFLYCAEAPTCASNGPVTRAMIKDGLIKGQELVYEAKISATQPSYTAQCLAAKKAGVEALLVAHANAIAERVVDQCAQQGYRPLIMSGGGVVNELVAKNPNFDGAINTQTNVPLSAPGEANEERLEALRKYAPELTPDNPQYNATIGSVWGGGKLFEAAAEAGDLGPDSTPEDVRNALQTLKDEDLGGFAPPLTFTDGPPYQVNCAFIESVQDGKLTTEVHGAEPYCIPGDASKYLKMLAG
jgi:branched-chain amino acid transport system substrate-binding protein